MMKLTLLALRASRREHAHVGMRGFVIIACSRAIVRHVARKLDLMVVVAPL
jgi:hypothetical protein